MDIKCLLSVLVSTALPLCAFAEDGTNPEAASPASSPSAVPSLPPPAPDADELTKLLQDFLAGASRNDAAMHDRFWADDLIYTSSAGRRIGKADIMREVTEEAAAAAPEETSTYTAEDIRIQQYGATAVIAFRLVGVTTTATTTETAKYLNTGTFLKRDGKWQAVSWQATKIPAGDEPKK